MGISDTLQFLDVQSTFQLVMQNLSCLRLQLACGIAIGASSRALPPALNTNLLLAAFASSVRSTVARNRLELTPSRPSCSHSLPPPYTPGRTPRQNPARCAQRRPGGCTSAGGGCCRRRVRVGKWGRATSCAGCFEHCALKPSASSFARYSPLPHITVLHLTEPYHLGGTDSVLQRRYAITRAGCFFSWQDLAYIMLGEGSQKEASYICSVATFTGLAGSLLAGTWCT